MIKEQQIEDSFITKLTDLKYTHRSDIRDRDSLEKNFREKFQALNRVNLTDAEFARSTDRKKISEIIAYYKATGKKMPLQKSTTKNLLTSANKKKALA